jgi:hypothetical protein
MNVAEKDDTTIFAFVTAVDVSRHVFKLFVMAADFAILIPLVVVYRLFR